MRDIIYCKDCTYFRHAKVNDKRVLVCPASNMDITEDDFCSYAKPINCVKLSTLNPGHIFNFAEEQFIVLDQRNGTTFILLTQSKESCPFNDKDNVENRNDYTCSTLKERIDKWVENLPLTTAEAAAILPFEVDLSCTDRSKSYGSITVKAAPLTLWQYGQFKELIPLNEDDWYWLVTPWACRWLRSPYTGITNNVWHVNSYGVYGSSGASDSRGIRPALLLNSDLLVSLEED